MTDSTNDSTNLLDSQTATVGFVPELMTSAQFVESLRRPAAYSRPEEKLLLSVLLEATSTALNIPREVGHLPIQRSGLVQEALDWFEETNSSNNHRFSFEQICEFLNIDPDYFRTRLARQLDAQKGRPSINSRIASYRAGVKGSNGRKVGHRY